MQLKPTTINLEMIIAEILGGTKFKNIKFYVNKKLFKRISSYYKGQSFINNNSQLEFFDFGKHFKLKPNLKKINILKSQTDIVNITLDYKFVLKNVYLNTRRNNKIFTGQKTR